MNCRILPLVAAAVSLLCGCDSGGSSPLLSEPLRAGVDRQVAASARLPESRPPTGGYDTAVVPEDPTRESKIGSAVAAAGGQQAQKAKEEKEIAGIEQRWAREKAGETATSNSASLPPPPQVPTDQ